MSQELIDFVRRELSMGAAPEDIKKALADGGVAAKSAGGGEGE